MATNGSLKPRQWLAVSALLEARNVQDAAKASGVGERTLFRWMTLPEFRAAMLTVESEIIDQATRRLLSLQYQAIDTLAEVLSDDQAGASVRLRAAQAVLDYLLKLRELRNLETRLVELEVIVYGKKGD